MSPSNPLFDAAGDQSPTKPPAASPASKPTANDNNSQAVDLIRAKINQLYTDEPDAAEEIAEAEAETVRHHSRHQQFMHSLSQSGKSLVEIQTAWHQYYQNLSDDEKRQVWQEFYQEHAKITKLSQSAAATASPHHQRLPRPGVVHSPARAENKTASVSHAPVSAGSYAPEQASPDNNSTVFGNGKSFAELKDQLLNKVSGQSQLAAKSRHQLKSLGFGLAMGGITLIILMFGFFNERFIAPFITPSRTVSSTPIITDITAPSAAVSPDPVIIIPKINIEIPVVYDEPSIDEAAVQRALERGVLHYPTTENPGEQGNAVFFGHSSSNILNNGKYKFAFVLLNRLEIGDTVMLQKDGQRYIYRVFDKKVVVPTDFSVLNDHGRPTATLITCDPPGTDTNRLVVTAEQISPDPATNVASSVPDELATAPPTLPSNAPTLWSRFWAWLAF